MGTYWQWLDYLTQQCSSAGKVPCYLNLDETSVPRALNRPVGYLVGKQYWPGNVAPLRPLHQRRRRAAITHVALIASLTHVQPKLPQIFLCNRHVVPAHVLRNPALDKPENVEIWRDKSGWNTVEKMVRTLQKIHDALAEFDNLQPILVLDAAMCHIHHQVAAAADRLGIWLVLVPARLTFLVQPLDVHALSPYKAFLQKAFAEREGDSGHLDELSWLQCLCASVRAFWSARKWMPAFERTGVVVSTRPLTVELQHIRIPRRSLIPTPLPRQEDVSQLFPRNRVVPYVSLFWQPARLDPPLLA